MAKIQKGFHSNEDYIDFINYAFGMNGAESSFPSLLPKLYGPKRESDKVTYFALEGDRIVGTVGAFPLTFHIGGETLSVRGIGSVATHPRHRGEGFMKELMKKAMDDMVADGIDFSVLGGRRHRYGHFGFEKCDGMSYFHLTPKTVSYLDPDRSGLTMVPVNAEDTALLDRLHAEMHSRPYYTERPREDLHDILLSWRSRPYAFLRQDKLVGWAVHYSSKRQLSEFHALDLAEVQGMLALATDRLGSLSVAVPSYDHPLAAEVDILAENVDIVCNECFAVFNWQRVLSALMTFKAERFPLIDGSMTIAIEGYCGKETLSLTVKNGVPTVEKTDAAPILTLSGKDAAALFFRNFSGHRQKLPKEGASWLPLPLFIFEPDNV